MILTEVEQLSFGPKAYESSTGLSGISKWINRRYRSSTPWGPHHFPLMSLWATAMGACTAAGESSFASVARAMLRLAFPQMTDSTSDRLIQLSNSSLPDAMHDFGCLNKSIPHDSPVMSEFKARFTAVQNGQPDAIRNSILFSMIVYKFEGQTVAAGYLLARLSGKAS